jgi:hypothetical protein
MSTATLPDPQTVEAFRRFITKNPTPTAPAVGGFFARQSLPLLTDRLAVAEAVNATEEVKAIIRRGFC